jgi:carboxyl-terminal processing protease
MKHQSVQSFLGSLSAVGIAVAVIGFCISPIDATARAGKSDLNHELDVFGEVLQLVQGTYVEAPDEKKLIEGAIKGMVTSLDPHSSYMTAKEFRDIRDQLSGEFGGLGVEITMKDGVIRVVSPIAGTPAARAGLLANDAIAGIDGKPSDGLSIDQAVDKLRGPAGTSVTLTISRDGIAKRFDVAMKREIIVINPVVAKAVGDIAEIKISSVPSTRTTG